MPREDSIRAQVAMTTFGELGRAHIVGKRVKDVGWAHPDDLGVDHYACVITLDDDTQIIAMSDDEGNDAGALIVSPPEGGSEPFTLPRI